MPVPVRIGTRQISSGERGLYTLVVPGPSADGIGVRIHTKTLDYRILTPRSQDGLNWKPLQSNIKPNTPRKAPTTAPTKMHPEPAPATLFLLAFTSLWMTPRTMDTKVRLSPTGSRFVTHHGLSKPQFLDLDLRYKQRCECRRRSSRSVCC